MGEILEFTVNPNLIDLFEKQAEQKILSEGWAKQGRNVDLKADNFVHCWITEEAFKQILIQNRAWFRYRGMYFGDASGAGADFTVRIDGKEVTIGLRSIAPDSLLKYKTVAYPDDRFQHEQDKIADYHIVCQELDGLTRFFGTISKSDLLVALEKSQRLYSARNQEHFRVVPLENFSLDTLHELLQKVEKVY